ncbi:NAD-dependent dehydratase [Cupriavidus sp. USMAA2-4]|uniref:NAD-dependent dehydratase n=1 Tax=Cupriavidus malaysiensis TaxID=367825 RepID=A0ABN4TK85_9BURK|nr:MULTISPECIES: complex I NDUFA9 subunit family protein [Cupriavidus]AOY91965.1 NAD-dependent dehydratase [Cupriavidus sp. USMAA2-4]AOY98476.1 NAD-dependent dehydratase [Cupriavidus sp. USMAHM13]AOZ04906.1 NAD-dependent dehydratase [Cupriavidus malaysiensis]
MQTSAVLVIGGAGFIGTHLVSRLAGVACASSAPLEPGTLTSPPIAPERIVVATRDVEHAQHLLLLPRVEVVELGLDDDAALDAAIGGLGVDGIVINLAGVLHGERADPYGPAFAAAHVQLPERILASCGRTGVRRLLHTSALGADSAGPSMYLRSKGDGELAVRDSDLDWTIFRPSVVFGPDDHFLNMFAQMQEVVPLVPLACAQARFQPIYVQDLAQAMVNAVASKATIRRIFELGGPQVYTLEELVRFAGRASGHPRPVLALPDALARVEAAMLEHMPGQPLVTRDNLDSMRLDNVLSAPMAAELGIHPASLESVMTEVLAGRTRDAELQGWRGSVHR